MAKSASQTTDEKKRRQAPSWFVAAIAGLFGLFYAYAVWAGVANILAMSEWADVLGGALAPTALVALILAIALPIVLFTLVIVIGRRRPVWKLIVLFFVGLGLIGVYWINLQSMFTNITFVFV
ncbi:hypothetical protein [Microbacterium amylolyticum]|uniref:Glucan phosphoethanolaminetransferase (Alkaline phosphatase superfamily) n=1 Tax=Microbacterium amylolyticum TaxID=936337 RepID=A0ABS4ZKJ6_9MICO|nr:hypothetical protein [Microbacterium amylolyticum]MBP2437818.1 glucan phosphoethanolaminetransferase (alkaline phosphatase superfamily) [Microbacterium amylolyticum]